MLATLFLTHICVAFIVTLFLLASRSWVLSAIGWVTAIWFIPFLGAILYAFLSASPRFFVSRRVRRAISPNSSSNNLKNVLSDKWCGLDKLGQGLGLGGFSSAYQVTVSVDGDCISDMLQEIDNAQSEIMLCNYIYSGQTAEAFTEALKRAKDRGVLVYLLIDVVGSETWRFDLKTTRSLKKSGIRYTSFSIQGHLISVLPSFNVRNHSKILCIDNRVAFVGSMNIRDEVVQGMPQAKYFVHNLNVKVTGKPVHDASEFFRYLWHLATGEVIVPHRIHHEFSDKGVAEDSADLAHRKSDEQQDFSAHDGDHKICRAMFRGVHGHYNGVTYPVIFALNRARKKVLIRNPYFLPPRTVRDALLATVARGVSVELLLSAKTNNPVVNLAVVSDFERYIKAGVDIYLAPAPFDHSKVMIVDDDWCMVGSSNFDHRSFDVNFEFNFEFLDRKCVHEMNKIVLKSRRSSTKLTKEFKLSTARRIGHNFARLLASQL